MTATEELIIAKLDILIEGQHRHDLRLQPLEADLQRRNERRRGAWKAMASVVVLVFGTALLTAFGLRK